MTAAEIVAFEERDLNANPGPPGMRDTPRDLVTCTLVDAADLDGGVQVAIYDVSDGARRAAIYVGGSHVTSVLLDG